MEQDISTSLEKVELRPVIGLTQGLSSSDLEALTVEAIRTHRTLVDEAEKLYEMLPNDYQVGKAVGGPQHLAYIKACIEMHAQMSALNTLLSIIGYIPKASMN